VNAAAGGRWSLTIQLVAVEVLGSGVAFPAPLVWACKAFLQAFSTSLSFA